MTIDPDQIRAEIDTLLARLPDTGGTENTENAPSLDELEAGDDHARDALRRWSLLHPD